MSNQPSSNRMHLVASSNQFLPYPLSPLEFLILLEHQDLLKQPQLNPPPPTRIRRDPTPNLTHPRPFNSPFLKNTARENKFYAPQQKNHNALFKGVNGVSSTSTSELSGELGKFTAGNKVNPQSHNQEATNIKCAIKLVDFLSQHFPAYSIKRMQEGLVSYYNDRPLKVEFQPVNATPSPQISEQRAQLPSDLPEYSYLKASILPPTSNPPNLRYDLNGCKNYDMVITGVEQRTKQDELRFMEQRFAAHVFCNKGYGLNHFREAIGQTEYEYSKDRYKSLIGTTIRLGFRKIEQFLLYRMKRNISALKRVEVKALLTPLLNIHTEFDQKSRETFNRCIRTTFRIQTQPALDTDVLLFYKTLVTKTRGPNFAHIVDKKLSDWELAKLQNKIYETNVLWTPTLQKEYIEIYLRRLSLSGIKQEFQKKYCPQIDPQHFEHSRLRARCDKIFTSCLRKANFLLDRAGLRSNLLILSDRLKKIVSRSPVASHIRFDLCQVYLQRNITTDFVCGVVDKIKKMVNQHKHLFQNLTHSSEEVAKFKNQGSWSQITQQNGTAVSMKMQNTMKIQNPKKMQHQRKRGTHTRKQKQSLKTEQESAYSSEQFGTNEEKYLIKMQQDSSKLGQVKFEQEDSKKAENIFYSESSEDQKAAEQDQAKPQSKRKNGTKAKRARAGSDDSFDQIQRLIQEQQKVMKSNRWD